MSLFYNYNKEGPGVRKDAPKKKTFFLFFETLFKNIWKMIPINFVYSILFLLPVGFAAVGITDVTRSLSRDKHTFGMSDFFSAIKANIKQAISVGLINNIVTGLLIFSIWFYFQLAKAGGTLPAIFLGAAIFFLICFTVMKFYIWFMVITFDFSISQLYKNAYKFVIINLLNNFFALLGIVAYWAINYGVLCIWPTPFALAVLSLFAVGFYPTYRYLIIQFAVFPSIKKCIIDPYYEEHPDLDIEKRRRLGLDVGDETSDFEDLI